MNQSKIPEPIARALNHFRSHTPVVIPTETVYGLAAPVGDPEAIRSIFTIKKRPLFDPLIVHVSSIEMAKKYTLSWSPVCNLLAEAFWPGPLTLILPKNHLICDLVTSGRPNVGLRMPRQQTTLQLITLLGEGLAAPSANKFGRTSPTCSQHVKNQFDQQIFILDDGQCSLGLESTVCEVHEEKKELLIYRRGLCRPQDLIATLEQNGKTGYCVRHKSSSDAPGQEATHYRPLQPLVVYTKKNAQKSAREIAQKKWGKRNTISTSLPEDPLLAARVLYKKLQNPKLAPDDLLFLYAPICKTNHFWLAIEDRLRKAASLFVDDEQDKLVHDQIF